MATRTGPVAAAPATSVGGRLRERGRRQADRQQEQDDGSQQHGAGQHTPASGAMLRARRN